MADFVLLQAPPPKLESIQKLVFTPSLREFLAKLHGEFDMKIEMMYRNREKRNLLVHNQVKFGFKQSPERLDKTWMINPLPPRLQNRQVDLGDVSASNAAHFAAALNADVEGIQVDFDDGHCPTWKNQLLAYNNIMLATHATYKLPGAPVDISCCPLMLVRPRAWNIIENNILINGKAVPGALIDFGVHMFLNSQRLYNTNSGPYFYLPKLESASEAKLWNDIFLWAQKQMNLPRGSIKACVLVENIFAVFELEEILYALREHSLGLNCGIWDYCASVIAKLGDRKQFLLPDRNKYVNMKQHFLDSYVQLVVATCHARGAPATGGMIPDILPDGSGKNPEFKQTVLKCLKSKNKEIDIGVDGFLVYDIGLVPFVNELWDKAIVTPNQIHLKLEVNITPKDLLSIPCGGATMQGLARNVAITIMFIYHWLGGAGHFFYESAVEDSATAEISRWQVWQWVRFGVQLEDDEKRVSVRLVEKQAAVFILEAHRRLCRSNADRKRLTSARYMSLELFLARNPPEFITTYLNDNHKFRALNNKAMISHL